MSATLYNICFSEDSDGYVELSLGGVSAQNRKWLTVSEAVTAFESGGTNMFFGPVLRRERGKMGKSNCWKTSICWVDVDSEKTPAPVLPPSAVVRSGHGWHLYWIIEPTEDLDRVEQANLALAKQVHGDSAHNMDRLMRIPGTVNLKDGQDPVDCQLAGLYPHRKYKLSSLLAVGALSDSALRKILTGDRRGYRTASERDWAIITSLVEAGMTDQDIRTIFAAHSCGDKAREDGDKYLNHTLAKARRKDTSAAHPLQERNNCYYTTIRGGSRMVSTFVLEPTLLLEGEDEDWIMSDVKAHGDPRVWKNVPFPRSAFSRISTFSRYLPRTSWAWLGSDTDVRNLLAYLNAKMQANKVPHAQSTHILGYHIVGDSPYFVLNEGAIDANGDYLEYSSSSPIVYVGTGRECPNIGAHGSIDKDDLKHLADIIPRLNEPSKIWPIIGWAMAAPLKTKLHQVGYHFPILNVSGTRGSGKTATIQEFIQPLLGYIEPSSYDIGTTKFVAMSLMGSTNALPISFSEFRASVNFEFHRYIRLAYDMGKDARGRADQTTVEYPLIAPIIIDGEDKVDDPAIQERALVVSLSPHTIREFEDAYEAFHELAEIDLRGFALPYYTHALNADVDLLIDSAEQDIMSAFPVRLPDRIRKNLTVCWFGILSFAQFMESQGVRCMPNSPEILGETLSNVYSYQLERAPVAADDYVEYIVNMGAQGRQLFPYELDGKILWFQNAPAYDSYTVQRTRQRKEVLSKAAIIGQLGEMKEDFIVGPEVRMVQGKRLVAYGIDIVKAKESGLDIPDAFSSNTFTVTF